MLQRESFVVVDALPLCSFFEDGELRNVMKSMSS